MLRKRKYPFFFWLWLLAGLPALAQEPGGVQPAEIANPEKSDWSYRVGEISISGNRKTKPDIILREIPFKTGDTYPLSGLVAKMEEARKRLINTSLFHSVVVAVKDFRNDTVHISIVVRERWYLFPLPYLKPADRNLNQWLFREHADFSRLNYGAKLLYNNATGRNDKLRLWLNSGYTRQVSFSYDRLYIDRKLRWGLNTGFVYGKNREVNYNTINDKQVFLKEPGSYVRSFINASVGLTYRPAIKTRHSFGVSFTSEEVSDTIVALNPAYFKHGRNRIDYPGLNYSMTFLDLDYIPYPTKGYGAQVLVSKTGLNDVVNLWQLQLKGLANWHFSSKTFFHLNGYAGIKLPFRQPYFSKRFLGYGDVFMQGYEYYVVDGVAGAYLKATLSRELLNFSVKCPNYKKGKETERVPFRIFGKIYGNTGYVHDPLPGENELSNKMLYSWGLGIDILTLYDVTFKLEWSFNQLGQNGLFLHRKTIF